MVRGKQAVSQFRQDPVTGDWVIIAVGRGKRPRAFLREKKKQFEQSIKECPFEDFEKSGNSRLLLEHFKDGKWFLRVIPNKYPALSEPANK